VSVKYEEAAANVGVVVAAVAVVAADPLPLAAVWRGLDAHMHIAGSDSIPEDTEFLPGAGTGAINVSTAISPKQGDFHLPDMPEVH
jgi:hypothetical protein